MLVCTWKIVIFCSKGKTGITWQFWSVAYAKRGRVILQCSSVLSLLGRRCFFQLFCRIFARVRTWVIFWPGCGSGQAAVVGPGEETSGQSCLALAAVGCPLLLHWIALLSPAPGARCHFANKFSVYCCLSLVLAAAERSVRTLLLMVATQQVSQPGRKHREKNVSFKKNPETTLTLLWLETKVKISGFFLGTVFVLLRTKWGLCSSCGWEVLLPWHWQMLYLA